MNTFFAFGACALGIIISLYIYINKVRHTKLACPREHACANVLHSRFSKTFGIPNEILGIGYFLSIATILLIPAVGLTTAWLLYVLFFLLVLGGLFSIYLIGLQAFAIRSWCAWCLGIAAINLVLIISLVNIPIDKFSFLIVGQKTLWIIIHNIGFVLGLGAATITDVLFFRFLKDKQISTEEKETMDTMTSVIWAGLAVLVVSGLALFISNSEALAVSSKFLLKVVVVGVIIINGILLNMFVGPHMRRLSFAGDVPSRRFRRLAFALGGVSISSWYLAFILGSLRNIPIDFYSAILIYGVFLACVVIGSQIAERKMIKAYQSET